MLSEMPSSIAVIHPGFKGDKWSENKHSMCNKSYCRFKLTPSIQAYRIVIPKISCPSYILFFHQIMKWIAVQLLGKKVESLDKSMREIAISFFQKTNVKSGWIQLMRQVKPKCFIWFTFSTLNGKCKLNQTQLGIYIKILSAQVGALASRGAMCNWGEGHSWDWEEDGKNNLSFVQ